MRDTVEYHEGSIEVAQRIYKTYRKWLLGAQTAEESIIEVGSLCREIEHNGYEEQEKILADMAEQEPVNRLRGASEHE